MGEVYKARDAKLGRFVALKVLRASHATDVDRDRFQREARAVAASCSDDHSGWPTRRQQVENIAFRVTLDATTTVVHLGDADISDAHFARDDAYWHRRKTHVAFPPYWFLTSVERRRVLERRIAAARSIGVHVPANVPSQPDQREPELRGHELFTMPGEVREIR